jgi:hypothetical protein
LGAILAFLKSVYGHKEKVIFGILVLVFIGVGYQQYKLKKNIVPNKSDSNPGESVSDNWKPSPPRKAVSYGFRALQNPYPLDTYEKLVSRKNIFEKPQKEKTAKKEEKAAEWATIKVKSVFDPTQSGSYIAIIEVDKRSRIVKEGQQFDDYEVQRVDGVRSCLSIRMKTLDEEREFCKEE